MNGGMPIPQPPSIGRIVHYYRIHGNGMSGPYAAIVINFGVGGLVDAKVFLPSGEDLMIQGIPCSMSGVPQPGHWNWPPRV